MNIVAERATNGQINGMATIVIAYTIGTLKSWKIGKLRRRREQGVGKKHRLVTGRPRCLSLLGSHMPELPLAIL